MPELPEVETIARTLRERIVGRTIDKVCHVRADMVRTSLAEFSKSLPGGVVESVARRAKRVVISLQPSATCVIHLGMSGRLSVVNSSDPLEKHTHLRVSFVDSTDELRFRDPRRFGGIWFFDGDSPIIGDRLAHVGPEPLEITLRQFRELMNRRRMLKAMLMDQAVIAGLGNIYCDESLHEARLHPQRKGDSLDHAEMQRLLRAIRSTLRRAIRFKGSTLIDYRDANGAEGSFQRRHRVYQRAGKPCRACGSMIERFVLNGRSTFVCPICQPSPS